MRFILFLLVILAFPLTFAALVLHLRSKIIISPPTWPLFGLFCTAVGWAVSFRFPSQGIVAILITAAPVALAIGSLVYWSERSCTVYHRIAVWGGLYYCLFVILFFWVVSVIKTS
jgi:hypothetical protein